MKTLDAEAVATAADELWHRILEGGDPPDLVVGIRTGGWEVARLLPAEPAASAVLPLTCRRPSTATKTRAAAFFRRIPSGSRDRLRLLEHRWLTRRGSTRGHERAIDPGEIAVIASWIAERRGPVHLLLVDDAVDTGATLWASQAAIREVAPPGTRIATAAITVTTSEPLVRPDHVLMEGWLCRFPWSLDA